MLFRAQWSQFLGNPHWQQSLNSTVLNAIARNSIYGAFVTAMPVIRDGNTLAHAHSIEHLVTSKIASRDSFSPGLIPPPHSAKYLHTYSLRSHIVSFQVCTWAFLKGRTKILPALFIKPLSILNSRLKTAKYLFRWEHTLH